MASLFQGSEHASVYAKFRPAPPKELVECIIEYAKSKINRPLKNAVDIGCGTGQSTLILAPYFEHVTGFDISKAQIENAREHWSAPNVSYGVSNESDTGIASGSVDVVTVGTALHYFDKEAFYKEAKRILVPNGVIAVYSSWLVLPKGDSDEKSEQFTQLIENDVFYGTLHNYRDARCDSARNHYRDVVLPFDDTVRHNFIKKYVVTVAEYTSYVRTISPFEAFRKEDPKKGEELLHDIQERIMKILGATTPPESTQLTVGTDFFLLLGTKPTEDPKAN